IAGLYATAGISVLVSRFGPRRHAVRGRWIVAGAAALGAVTFAATTALLVGNGGEASDDTPAGRLASQQGAASLILEGNDRHLCRSERRRSADGVDRDDERRREQAQTHRAQGHREPRRRRARGNARRLADRVLRGERHLLDGRPRAGDLAAIASRGELVSRLV